MNFSIYGSEIKERKTKTSLLSGAWSSNSSSLRWLKNLTNLHKQKKVPGNGRARIEIERFEGGVTPVVLQNSWKRKRQQRRKKSRGTSSLTFFLVLRKWMADNWPHFLRSRSGSVGPWIPQKSVGPRLRLSLCCWEFFCVCFVYRDAANPRDPVAGHLLPRNFGRWYGHRRWVKITGYFSF